VCSEKEDKGEEGDVLKNKPNRRVKVLLLHQGNLDGGNRNRKTEKGEKIREGGKAGRQKSGHKRGTIVFCQQKWGTDYAEEKKHTKKPVRGI